MQPNITQTNTTKLDLPVPEHFSRGCPRSVRMDLDNLAIAVESINLKAVDDMLLNIKHLNLDEVIPNRVSLWRLRNTNPIRRNYQRANLSWDQAKSLVLLICAATRPLNTVLRHLVTIDLHDRDHKIESLGLQQSKLLLDLYANRFVSLYKSRMRSPMILTDDEISDLAKHLLMQMLFSSGTAGEIRLWNALLDGATA